MKYVLFKQRGYVTKAVEVINKLDWAGYVSHMLPDEKAYLVAIILLARDDIQAEHFQKQWDQHVAEEKKHGINDFQEVYKHEW